MNIVISGRQIAIGVFGVLAMTLVGGCVAEMGEEAYSEESSATLSSKISQEWNWNQSMPGSVSMGALSTWGCFFTGMAGNFQGAGEVIQAVPLNPGIWQLYGSSFQQGVAARARCYKHGGATVGYGTWSQNDGARKDLGTGWGFCGLITVSGKFSSTTEFVKVVRETGNHWFLDGSSTTQDVRAGAACFTGAGAGSEYTWTSGRKNLETTGNSGGRFCYLTKVGGNFDNANDAVAISLDTTTNPEMWYITGSGSGAKEARARCSSAP